MKTYEERIKVIQAKAKRRKAARSILKASTGFIFTLALILGIMHIPYGSIKAEIPATNPPTNWFTDKTPTISTYPTLSTMPPTTFGPPVYPPDLVMDLQRIELIEDSWAKENKAGFAENLKFCHAATGMDGIRRYYSFMKEDYKGQNQRYDILYIPCQALPVPTEFTFSGHTFRSRNAFGLYVFSSQHLDSLDVTLNLFIPLVEYINSSTIEETALLVSVQMHNLYEEELYGSFLNEMPQENPADDLLRLKAAWLVNFGQVPAFEDVNGPRYYGTFSGYDIIFSPTQLTATQTQTIGGESFSHTSSFELLAFKDWQFYKLQDVYDQGLISQKNIVQLAQIHREPIDQEAVLAELDALVGDFDSWYNKVLTCEYDTPSQLVLSQFFLNAFREDGNKVTDSERAQLKDLFAHNPDYQVIMDRLDITRLPVERMNEVLQTCFGITLEDIDEAGFKDLVYLESTNCYYIIGGGASVTMDFQAQSIEVLYDGSICVYYTANGDDTVYALTLVWKGDGYKIRSNMRVPIQIQ